MFTFHRKKDRYSPEVSTTQLKQFREPETVISNQYAPAPPPPGINL